MKRTLLFLLFCVPFCRAQQPNQETRVWATGDLCCKVLYEDGRPREQFISENILIEVQPPVRVDKHTDSIKVVVYNPQNAKKDLDVNPLAMAASADDENHTVLQPVDADKMIAKQAHTAGTRNSIASALQGFGAGMSTRSATVHNSDGSTSTVTYHDPADDRAAQRDARARADQTNNLFTTLSAGALRRNTILSGHAVGGTVYFARPSTLDKKVPLNAVGIHIGDITYIFPFTNSTVPPDGKSK